MRTVTLNPIAFRRTMVSVLLAGLTSVAIALPLAGSAYAQVQPAATVSTTEAEMMAIAPELFGFLRASFPDDFSAFVAQVEQRVSTGGSADGMVQAHMLELRQKYAPHLAGASDAALETVLVATMDLQQAVFDGEGPAVCGNFAINGPAIFEGTPAAAKYEDLMMAQTVYMLAAAKGGHDAPVTRTAAVEADWKVITDMMTQAGVTSSGFEAISTLDAANPDLCPAMQTLLTAMNTEPTGAGARVRASYLLELVTAL